MASTEETNIPYPGPRGFLLILSFFIWKFVTRSADRSAEPRERKPLVKIVENLTFMLAQHLTAVKDVIFFWPITSPRYLIHPIIWLVEQLKISSNRKRRSKADGVKVRIPKFLTRGFRFSALSASCQQKNKRSGSRRKICQERTKESLWNRSFLRF